MMTVNEVSKLTGVSIRTLQYYDKIGLLHPSKYTESGYRLYDDIALEKLQQILLFRELEFSLKEINLILSNPDFDRNKAVEQQIVLLTLKKDHLENLINFARGIKHIGVNTMDFSAFDKKKQEEYAQQAKAKWGQTSAYKECAEKRKSRSAGTEGALNKGLMMIFEEFGEIKSLPPATKAVQALVKKLQSYITENYYTCSEEILVSLGTMYSAGGDFTENIDAVGGKGTAKFVAEAISAWTKSV